MPRNTRSSAPSTSSLMSAGSHGCARSQVSNVVVRTGIERVNVLAGEQPFQGLGARELREGFVEAARPKVQDAAGVVDHELGPGVGRRAETFLRAGEMALRLREAPHPHERHAGHGERTGRHRLVGPAVLLGNRDRQLAQLKRKRQRLPAERRRDCEMREAADLDERA